MIILPTLRTPHTSLLVVKCDHDQRLTTVRSESVTPDCLRARDRVTQQRYREISRNYLLPTYVRVFGRFRACINNLWSLQEVK